jgi:uncharacterized 2Fe-2S/4Fe-4S cluster protein (DUF4445 family)
MEILSNLNGSSKMVLKIKLQGTSAVKMQLVSINKDYVKKKNSNDFNFFQDEENEFVVWSTQDFVFNDRQIRIPDENHIEELMVYTHEFEHDMERYDVLKKMYKSLQNWADEMDFRTPYFKGSEGRKKVIIAGDYWFIT